jgi:hypothetical protein
MGGGERGTVNGISSAFTRIEAQLDGVKGAYREIFHEVLCRPSAMGGVKKGPGLSVYPRQIPLSWPAWMA